MVTVELSTVEAVASHLDFPALALAYEQEADSARVGMDKVRGVNFNAYLHLEAAGLIHVVAAHDGDRLIGFAVLLLSEHLHFSRMVATVEAIFALPETGAGAELMRFLEGFARQQGAAGLFISAPTGGRLDRVMRRSRSYSQTNAVFYKPLQGEDHGN
ncbi:MAG: hypothetical protein GXY45_11465 [Ramlibacter sp.]|nr:hypothetical protein [Ramlibacter sp.]